MRSLSVVLLLLPAFAEAQAPYVRNTTPDGKCLFWRTRHIGYSVDQLGNPDTTGDTEFSAIDSAFAAWQSAVSSCSDITFENLGRVAGPRAEYDAGGPNRNVIIFRQQLCSSSVPASDPCWASDSCGNQYGCWQYQDAVIEMPTVTFDPHTGEILDVDLQLNAASFVFTTVDAPPCTMGNYSQSCVASDVQNDVTAAVGQLLGLSHTTYPGSTLAPTSPPGDTSKRVIDPGSVSGICAIYPKGQPPTACDGGAVPEPVDAGTPADAGTPGTCGFASCAGCCDPSGRCQSGDTASACGANGVACAACSGSDECTASVCLPQPHGCGCTTSAPALALGVLLSLLARRVRPKPTNDANV